MRLRRRRVTLRDERERLGDHIGHHFSGEAIHDPR
jgi:hypothetical protein